MKNKMACRHLKQVTLPHSAGKDQVENAEYFLYFFLQMYISIYISIHHLSYVWIFLFLFLLCTYLK